MRFPRYPEYISSQLEGVAQIPNGWEVMRLRYLLRDGNEGMKIGPFGSALTSEMLDDDGPIKVLGQENVIVGDFERGARFIDDAKFGDMLAYEALPEDILVTMMGTSGRCCVVPPIPYRGIIDSHLLRMRVTPSARPQFVALLIDSAPYVGGQVRLAGKGSIMHGLNSSVVKDLALIVPSLGEQDAILNFLERELQRIDNLVAEQQQLTALLKEKQQAIILHAVTKGLNPDAPMKPSGVEWLGEVPAHWGVVRSGRYVGTITGFPFQSASFAHDEAATRLLRGVNVGVGAIRWDDVVYWERSPGDGLDVLSLEVGDIVLGMDRPIIKEGVRVAQVTSSDIPCLLLQRVAALKVGQSLAPAYLLSLLRSPAFEAHFAPETTGVSVPHISPAQINDFVIPLPPLAEQEQIAAYLEAIELEVGGLLQVAERAIDLLQERRSALISSAVTGQIDVRHLAQEAAA